MTPKERLLAAIKGREVDRLPWSPFLAYFWQHQSVELQSKGELAFLEEIGADPLFRGSHHLFDIKRKRCNVRETTVGNDRYLAFETPVGTLTQKFTYVEEAKTSFIVDHPIKCEEDFNILTYLNDDMELIANYNTFHQANKELGERGLYVPTIGSQFQTSFQSMLEDWVGTVQLAYAVEDYPQAVEQCLDAMRRNSIQSVEISAQSDAEVFTFWENSSTTNISPALYEKYIAPEITEWASIIHRNDKKLMQHACGHIRKLVPLMKETGIDIIESISPPPTGNIELWEAKEMLDGKVGLVGGIEPTVFLNSTLEQLETYVLKLIEKMGKKSFILANSDSCPPGVSIEKFKLVSEIVRRV